MPDPANKEAMEQFLASMIYVDKETVVDRDYSGVKSPQLESHGSTFTNCRFDSMRIDCFKFASGKKRSVYRDCSFDGIRIKRVMGGLVRFERCSFRNVLISGWSLQACDLVDCVFTGKMKSGRGGGSFWGAPMSHWQTQFKKRVNEFRGNNFSDCALVDMDFRTGIDLRLQVLPQGPDYFYIEDGKSAIKRAMKAHKTWRTRGFIQKHAAFLRYFTTRPKMGRSNFSSATLRVGLHLCGRSCVRLCMVFKAKNKQEKRSAGKGRDKRARDYRNKARKWSHEDTEAYFRDGYAYYCMGFGRLWNEERELE